MKRTWADRLKGKVVLVGIGNPLRGDDAVGPRLIERLQGKVEAELLDTGTAPESYIGRIAKAHPDTVLMVDAVHLDRAPGEFDLLEKGEILQSGFTTHDVSPHLFMDCLEKETQANIYLLGVQPQDISLGSEMSEPVRKALDEMEQTITETLHA
jgi:hydrogenase 3 maturation protease